MQTAITAAWMHSNVRISAISCANRRKINSSVLTSALETSRASSSKAGFSNISTIYRVDRFLYKKLSFRENAQLRIFASCSTNQLMTAALRQCTLAQVIEWRTRSGVATVECSRRTSLAWLRAAKSANVSLSATSASCRVQTRSANSVAFVATEATSNITRCGREKTRVAWSPDASASDTRITIFIYLNLLFFDFKMDIWSPNRITLPLSSQKK
jgi:hypothetical protein